jgi:hypothetical protein
MKNMRENENSYDVIIDDGGRIYKMEFTAGTMTKQEVIDDFLRVYDGEIDETEIEVIFTRKSPEDPIESYT